MCGVRAVDRIVELCERDLAFIWLTGDVLNDLSCQFLRRLQKKGLITLKELFIDGTKIEANANRYMYAKASGVLTR